METNLKGKEILITGGCGTLGKAIVKHILKHHPDIHGIRIYSRDEEKHRLFQKELSDLELSDTIAFLIGDVRDLQRLTRAMNHVDIVIHTAAMKQIPYCEYNPIEAVRTNVEGTCNVIDASINNLVEKVMLISTDKACYPINLYGATKATAEKLFLHANVYSPHTTKFAVCRYGNVFGSRGSVVQIWKEQYEKIKKVTITSKEMTRFWIKVEEVAQFVTERIRYMDGGEIFIPKMKSISMEEFSKVILPEDVIIKETMIRAGEKLHEFLITKEESFYTTSYESYYKINQKHQRSVIPYTISSDKDDNKFTQEELKNYLFGGTND